MAELNSYKLSMTGQEADTGIRVGMQLGALNGIPYSNGNNEISEARPGTDYGYPLLQGNGPPTANTAANFGQHYYDLSATEPPYEYICVAFTESGGFIWKSHDDAAMHAAIYNAYIAATAFGKIAEIDDGADNIPVKSLVVDIDPAQSGSGEPSPDNIRPISGWTGVKVIRAGKNFMKPPAENQTINGVTFTLNADGTVTANGTATAITDLYYVGAVNVYADAGIPTGNYLVNGGNLPPSSVGSIFIIPQGSSLTAHAGGGDLPFSFDANKKYRIFYRINAGQTVNNLVISLMVRLATETDSAYEPYTANTYEITFPVEAGTVYGGMLDVTNGVLTLDSIIVRINDALTKSYQSEQQRFALDFKNMNIKIVSSGRSIDGLYAESFFPAVSGANNTMFHSNTQIYIYDNRFVDAASFLADCGDTRIVIPVATPATYQLTPLIVKTLLGANNFWADTGDVNVTYRADPTLIYNKLTAAIISSGGI